MSDEFGSGFDEFGPLEDTSDFAPPNFEPLTEADLDAGLVFPGETFVESDIPEGGAEIFDGPLLDEYGMETAPEADLSVFDNLSEEEFTAGMESFNPDDYSPEMVDAALDNIAQNPLEEDGMEIAPEADLSVFDNLSEEEFAAGMESFNPDEYSPEMVDAALDNIAQNPIEDENGMEFAPEADLSVFDNLSEEEFTAGMESFNPDDYSPEAVENALDFMAQNPIEDMDAPKTLTRDQTEQWIIGNNAIDNTVEAMRDNLRDLGMEDGPDMEAIVMGERAKMQEELSRNIEGDFSQSYEMPNFQELYGDTIVESDIPEGGAEIIPDPDEEYIIEGPEGAEIFDGPILEENALDDEIVFPGETIVESDIPEGGVEIIPDPDEEYIIEGPEGAEIFDGPILEEDALDDEIVFPGETIVESDIPEGGVEIIPDSVLEPAQAETTETPAEKPFDYDSVKEHLDKEFIEDAFKDIDCFDETEKLDPLIDSFEKDKWEHLDKQERLDAMENLKDYLSNKLDLKNPPTFDSYNKPDSSDFGYYDPKTNKLCVNEYVLANNSEAVDTVAHELWHAKQHQLAANATEPRHFQYQYQFEHYEDPNINPLAYRNQLVEKEARAFGAKFKEYLNNRKGA